LQERETRGFAPEATPKEEKLERTQSSPRLSPVQDREVERVRDRDRYERDRENGRPDRFGYERERNRDHDRDRDRGHRRDRDGERGERDRNRSRHSSRDRQHYDRPRLRSRSPRGHRGYDDRYQQGYHNRYNAPAYNYSQEQRGRYSNHPSNRRNSTYNSSPLRGSAEDEEWSRLRAFNANSRDRDMLGRQWRQNVSEEQNKWKHDMFEQAEEQDDAGSGKFADLDRRRKEQLEKLKALL